MNNKKSLLIFFVVIIVLSGFLIGKFLSRIYIKKLPVISSNTPKVKDETNQIMMQKVFEVTHEHPVSWNIPDTNLTIDIPNTTYTQKSKSINSYIAKDIQTLLGIDILPNLSFGYGGSMNLFIWSVKTTLTPYEWESANVYEQGQPMSFYYNDNPTLSASAKKIIKINGIPMYQANFGCCGGYYQTYMVSVNTLNNQNEILGFTTTFALGQMGKNDGSNILLDRIIQTLHSSTIKQ